MRQFVAVVICAAIVVPVAGALRPGGLLRTAAKRSGLAVRGPVRVATERNATFTAHVQSGFDREYPPALQQLDDVLDSGLGLAPSGRPTLLAAVRSFGAWYDPARHILRVRRTPPPTRAERLRELVRALIDQNFGLRRLTDLRARDRDRFLAAKGVVDGLASLASGLRASAPSGLPLEKFLATERSVGPGPGRAFVSTLRSVGGRYAVSTALRKFPQTTEQLLHVDKFLEHEPALPVSLPGQVADLRLAASETFGELDVRALLQAFGVQDADSAAAGWGGGRLALYMPVTGDPTVALVLRWDTDEDAKEWLAVVPSWVAAAFPGAKPAQCPAVSACWLDGAREIAFSSHGRTTTFGSGPGGELVAATLAR